jgi:hypothetical protein
MPTGHKVATVVTVALVETVVMLRVLVPREAMVATVVLVAMAVMPRVPVLWVAMVVTVVLVATVAMLQPVVSPLLQSLMLLPRVVVLGTVVHRLQVPLPASQSTLPRQVHRVQAQAQHHPVPASHPSETTRAPGRRLRLLSHQCSPSLSVCSPSLYKFDAPVHLRSIVFHMSPYT